MLDLPVSTEGRTAEDIARLCADEASRIAMERFRHPGEVRSKGRGNVVTEADLAVEASVLKTLRTHFPDHLVLSEETSASVIRGEPGWLWVVDPIDGTFNYSRGIPNFAFNIALCYDGEPVLALTRSPVTGDEYFACRGSGLLADGEPAAVSEAATLRDSALGLDLGYDNERAAKLLGVVSEIWPGIQSVRIMGSTALGLALAASGRLDVFVHHAVLPWDIAAGILLVAEGGGIVVSRDGSPASIFSEGIVAGARAPVAEFVERFGSRPGR